jgi:hypothetical protein
MKDYIINSFIIQDNNTLIDIYNYIKIRYDNSVKISYIKLELTKLIKNNIIIFYNKNYNLSNEGNVILNDHKYYYSKIIIKFYKKYSKNSIKYQLIEIRREQKQLRNYLIANKTQMCIICEKKLPLCLLETAHLKPRCILNNNEKNDKNIVEFMCRYCHNLYDNGFLAVYKGILKVSTFINQYDLHYKNNKQIPYYNLENEIYFTFHYNYIYKKDSKPS